MAEKQAEKIVYVSHPASGLARSNFPLETHISGDRILRSLPFHIPEDTRLYEIKTTNRGTYTRPRKEVQMPLAIAHKQRVHSENRVRYPMVREDWSPENPNASMRGVSGYKRIGWDEATDIIAGELKRIHATYGSMEPVFVQADGHGHSGYMQSLHFWGHYLFDMIQKHLDWGWWTQQVRNPDSWEGYYWGAKHVWGFNGSLGEPYQDAVWDDVLENAEMVIFSGCDPEATGLGMSGGIALEMPKWLKKAGIKIVSISPDLNYASAVHADTWIPIKPNTDAALYLAVAHNWIAEDTYDKAYVASHTIGFDAFRAHVLGEDDGIEKTPKWGEEMTGVPAHTIKALAREWARKKTTLSVYFGGPKVRGTLSHLSARMEAYVLAMQGIGSPGQQFLQNRCAVFLQERPGAGAALSGGRFQGSGIEPNDRIRHRPRTGIAVLRTAYPGRRSDPQRSDRMEKHYLCAGEDRRPVQNIPVPAVAGSPRHPHGMERKRQPARQLGERVEVAQRSAQSAD